MKIFYFVIKKGFGVKNPMKFFYVDKKIKNNIFPELAYKLNKNKIKRRFIRFKIKKAKQEKKKDIFPFALQKEKKTNNKKTQ